jgi:hypothetical protein
MSYKCFIFGCALHYFLCFGLSTLLLLPLYLFKWLFEGRQKRIAIISFYSHHVFHQLLHRHARFLTGFWFMLLLVFKRELVILKHIDRLLYHLLNLTLFVELLTHIKI